MKAVGHSHGGGGLLGFAKNVISAATGGAKFSKEDVKRVYFVCDVVEQAMRSVLIFGTGKLASRLLPGKHDDVVPLVICEVIRHFITRPWISLV